MLTEKEIKVLELKKKGLKQIEIAKKLKISQPSVSLFESNIKRKLMDSSKILGLVKKMEVSYNKKENILRFKDKKKSG